MKTIMTFAVALACCAVFAQEEVAPVEETTSTEEVEVCEEECEKSWSIGVDVDFFSAYVWRNAVQNDEMVIQPCVWADWNVFGPFSVGGFIWQNYDLTLRRRGVYKSGANETDFNIHGALNLFESEEGEHSVDLEIGHEWYWYNRQVRRDMQEDYPSTRELYAKLSYANPIVNVYGQCSWMYKTFGVYKNAFHYELGFNKEVEVSCVEGLAVGADWNVSFGDRDYLYFLFGGTPSGAYDHNDDPTDPDIYDDYDNRCGGFGGTTIKLYSSYQLTDWCSIKATIAYTGLLNGSLRDSIGEQDDGFDFYNTGAAYRRDLLWGGLSLNFEF